MNDVTRKLASIRRIDAIDPIPGADRIVKATIDGWSLVTQVSNNFQPNDLVIFFEVDSFLPVRPEFEFLRESSLKVMDGEEGFRLKTIKLKGTLSQGLILPLDTFFPVTSILQEGDDLTTLLGVKKWEKPLPAELYGKARGNFPDWLVKTDQERIQNVIKYRSRYEGRLYEASLKLDGSSMTVYVKDGYVGVCSRNLDLMETEGNTFWATARRLKMIEALEAFWQETGRNIAIQGELMGPGIQGNREGLKTQQFFAFDVFDIDRCDYLDVVGKNNIITHLGVLGAVIPTVPIRETDKNVDGWTTERFLSYADQPSLTHPIAEGIVFKSMTNPRNSFKVINTKFLLKEKD